MTIKIMVRTSGGTFYYPSGTQIANIQLEQVRYDFAHELKAGAKVLLRKNSAEELTLEDHIIPTLWIQSPQYRQDRSAIFEGSGPDAPTITKLGSKLRKVVIRYGINASDAASELHVRIPKDFGYSQSAVSGWLSGNVMLPKYPEVLPYINHELGEWARQEEVTSAVRRLRVVHSGIRAVLARSNGQENGGQSRETNSSGEGVVSLAEYLSALRKQYGKNILKQFVKPVTVLSVSEVNVEAGETHTSQHLGTEKGVISFSPATPSMRQEALDEYDGTTRTTEIENGLRERMRMISIIGIVPITDTVLALHKQRFWSSYLEINFAVGKAVSVFNSIMGDKQFTIDSVGERLELQKLLLADQKKRERFRKGMRAPPEEFLSTAADFPYSSAWLKRIRTLYNTAPVDKTMPFTEYFYLLSGGMQAIYSYLIEPFVNLSKSEYQQKIKTQHDTRIKEIHFVHDSLPKYGLDKIYPKVKGIESSARLPQSLLFLQDFAVTSFTQAETNLIGKLSGIYGVKDLSPYAYTVDLVRRVSSRIAILNPEVKLDEEPKKLKKLF